MDTTNYDLICDLIYEIIILIFVTIAVITLLYMIYLKSKAWHKLNLESRKLVRRLYIICRISYMIVAAACTFLIYSVYG